MASSFELEEWRDIQGYEGLYQVSNLGRVRSLDREVYTSASSKRGSFVRSAKGAVMKQGKRPKDNGAYLFVILQRHGKSKAFCTHRLVAEAFIPNPDGKSQVNHIDGNKANNAVSNLEWVTPKENTAHAFAHGLRSDEERLRRTRKSVIRSDGMEFNSITEAARSVEGSIQNISACINGKRRSAYGYEWREKSA